MSGYTFTVEATGEGDAAGNMITDVEAGADIYGFADIMAHTLVEGLKENISEMQSLIENGTISIQEEKTGGLLEGKSFCFTGELMTMKRTEAQNLVNQMVAL